MAWSVLVGGPGTARAEEPKKVSAQELARLGFFQDFDELDLEELLTVEEATVSIATRSERTLRQAPGVVSVIDHVQIRELGARNLVELIQLLPGFDVVIDRLGHEKIVTRGLGSLLGGSESVLLLLDGQRIGEAIHGGATVLSRRFPTLKIKRLEVLRGPGSALYGGGALAAVINVVSFGTDELTGFEVHGGGGSFGTGLVGLRLGGPLGSAESAGVSYFETTGGAQLPIPADAQSVFDLTNPQLDPISLAPGQTSAGGRVLESLYRVSWGEFAIDWLVKQDRSDGYVGISDSLGIQNEANNRQMMVAASYERAVGESGTFLGRASWNRSEIAELHETFPPNVTFVTEESGSRTYPSGGLLQMALNSDRIGLEGLYENKLQDHHLNAGASLEREATRNLEAFANVDYRTHEPVGTGGMAPMDDALEESSRSILAAFVQDTWLVGQGNVAITGGLRLDHYSDVGTQASPQLGVVWSHDNGVTLKGLYGRSFRAPSFRELHFELPGLQGNPELEPTTANTLQAVVGYSKDELDLSAGLFVSYVRNSIVPEAAFSVREPQLLVNGPGLDLKGLEIEARGTFGDHIGFASLTLQNPTDADTGERAADVSRLLGNLGVTLTWRERFTATPRLVFRSSRTRAAGDPRPDVEGYLLVDLSLAAQRVLPALDLRATFKNLFDKEYFDPSPALGVPGDYPRPGFSLVIDATYRF